MTTTERSEDGRLRRMLEVAERFLGWRVLSLAAFVVLADEILKDAGYQSDEVMLAVILYINFSTKIEEMHAAMTKKGQSA